MNEPSIDDAASKLDIGWRPPSEHEIKYIVHVVWNGYAIQLVEYDNSEIHAYHMSGGHICRLFGGMLSAQIAALGMLGCKL